MECEMMRWIVNKEIIPLYIDTAKSFLNVSSAALGLTIVFREKVVGVQLNSKVGLLMISSWLFYLLTIGASVLYQYLAVKFLDSVSCARGTIQYFETLVANPGIIYGIMLVFFFIASLLLIATASKELLK